MPLFFSGFLFFRAARNYLFDLRVTNIKGMKLNVSEAINLIKVLGADVEF